MKKKIMVMLFILISCGKQETKDFEYGSISINNISCSNCIKITYFVNKIIIANYNNFINQCNETIELTLDENISNIISSYSVTNVNNNCYGLRVGDNIYFNILNNNVNMTVSNNNIELRRL